MMTETDGNFNKIDSELRQIEEYIHQLEAKNERLMEGLANLATMTLIREHSVNALVEQLSDIHKMALSIITDLDVDALKEGG